MAGVGFIKFVGFIKQFLSDTLSACVKNETLFVAAGILCSESRATMTRIDTFFTSVHAL